MKKILIITIPENGHINPMVGIAQELQNENCELHFFSVKDIQEKLNKAKLKYNYHSIPKKSEKEFITQGKDFIEKIQNKSWLKNWIKTLLLSNVKNEIPIIQKLVKKINPDIMLLDPMIYSAIIVAETENIMWAGISSSLNPLTPDTWKTDLADSVKELYKERDFLFSEYGLSSKFKVCDAISPWLNTVYSTPNYAPRYLNDNNFSFYLGHSFPKNTRGDEINFPFDKLKKDSYKIYISMGSQIFYQPELFNKFINALNQENIQLILSIGDLYYEDFYNTLPNSVITVPYAPQLQLLPHIDLMVSHGGANSVMECLANACPMVLVPICNDQFFQAEFMKRSGAGIVLDKDNLSVDLIKEKVLPLLKKDSKERLKAIEISKSYQKYGGVKKASELIIKLCNEKKALLPDFGGDCY